MGLPPTARPAPVEEAAGRSCCRAHRNRRRLGPSCAHRSGHRPIGATAPWCQHRRGDGRPRSDPVPCCSVDRTRSHGLQFNPSADCIRNCVRPAPSRMQSTKSTGLHAMPAASAPTPLSPPSQHARRARPAVDSPISHRGPEATPAARNAAKNRRLNERRVEVRPRDQLAGGFSVLDSRAISTPPPGHREHLLPATAKPDRHLEEAALALYWLWFNAVNQRQDPSHSAAVWPFAHGRSFISKCHRTGVDEVHHGDSTPSRRHVWALTGNDQQWAAVSCASGPDLDGLAPVRNQVRKRLLNRESLQDSSTRDRPLQLLPQSWRNSDLVLVRH